MITKVRLPFTAKFFFNHESFAVALAFAGIVFTTHFSRFDDKCVQMMHKYT